MKEAFIVVDANLSETVTAKTFDVGKHSITFTFTLPLKFSWKGKVEYDLPPAFVGNGLPQSLAYDLEVHVLKKGMFSTNELSV